MFAAGGSEDSVKTQKLLEKHKTKNSLPSRLAQEDQMIENNSLPRQRLYRLKFPGKIAIQSS
jgi:hypothetical protein